MKTPVVEDCILIDNLFRIVDTTYRTSLPSNSQQSFQEFLLLIRRLINSVYFGDNTVDGFHLYSISSFIPIIALTLVFVYSMIIKKSLSFF